MRAVSEQPEGIWDIGSRKGYSKCKKTFTWATCVYNALHMVYLIIYYKLDISLWICNRVSRITDKKEKKSDAWVHFWSKGQAIFHFFNSGLKMQQL
jgi:hypothetical protein